MLDEAEARQLPALIAEWSERSDALSWIARALQLDLPLLIERPELVLTCLYRRCHWLGDREMFYPKRGEAPREAKGAAALVDEWVAARPGRWLRALRPPRFPLEAAIVEEYRTSIEGDAWFSADSSVIGVAGKDGSRVAWERVTGRRIDRFPESPTPRWRHEYAVGRISLVASDRRLDLSIPDAETASTAFDLGDELFLVETWWEEDPYDYYNHAYVLYLVDCSTGRIQWRTEGRARAAIRIGDTLVTQAEAITTRSLATGATLSSRGFGHSYSGTFSPDGRVIASRDRSVIRIWDLAALAKVEPSRVVGGELSPDGTRLLAGAMLCDAQTGAVIAEIPFNGRGEWLEGGPPSNAWELVDNVIVEVMPWRVTIWSSATGEALADYQCSAGVRDSVRNDPRGRYLALFRHPDRLRVLDTLSGASLFQATVNVVEPRFRDRSFGFSESGDELWWETEQGSFAVPTGAWQPIREAPIPEQRARSIEVTDGLLVVGELAAPMDSAQAESTRDGSIFVGADHYRIEG